MVAPFAAILVQIIEHNATIREALELKRQFQVLKTQANELMTKPTGPSRLLMARPPQKP